jgi:NodT family efflux transporter outer membrane factor (OMF) lipoprotein
LANQTWRQFFNDPYLSALIDTALNNNQELNITLREIEISQNEVLDRQGEYLPSFTVGSGFGVEKVGRFTSQGANDANTHIDDDREFPELLPDFLLEARATWELDFWRKLRNAKKAAVTRYLASIEGRNFMVTNLISEIAESYYELLALDNQLEIIRQNVELQRAALRIVRLSKQAGEVTELAVRKFEAEVFHTRSLQFDIQQHIVETENRINFLLGRYPEPILRDASGFKELLPKMVTTGVPAQLLANRPDIRQAELDLTAARLDVQVARAQFYPSIGISAGVGLQAFNPTYLVKAPESFLFGLAADAVGPIINRNAIKAAYASSNSRQVQAVFNYERSILTAYVEVMNLVSGIDKLNQSYALQQQEVEALTQAIEIANTLFKSTRADYMEVLLTQRDALESRIELVETKQRQLVATVGMYRALGGGWR